MDDINNYCFVIQPLRDKKYTKRFTDTYEPAIKETGLQAYRVDLDPSARDLMTEIENRIQRSVICFADISMDNPNVWYELGYAHALKKDVVLVCDETRKKFPFDISHISVIKYKTESVSDYDTLKQNIINKIKGYLTTQSQTVRILPNPIKETDELKSYEIALLASIAGEQTTDEKSVPIYKAKDLMNNLGYKDLAVSLGVRVLVQKEFIITSTDTDWNGDEFEVCKLTEKGISFILNNSDLFNLEQQIVKKVLDSDNENIPF